MRLASSMLPRYRVTPKPRVLAEGTFSHLLVIMKGRWMVWEEPVSWSMFEPCEESNLLCSSKFGLVRLIERFFISNSTVSASIGSISFNFCKCPFVSGSNMLPRKLYTRAKSGMAASSTRLCERRKNWEYVWRRWDTNDTTTVNNINATRGKYGSRR